MRSRMHLRAAMILFVGTGVLPGCGASDAPKPPAAADPGAGAAAHDPDDVPITEADVDMPANYGDAVERIKGYRDSIRSAIESGSPSKAHRSLDELDIVLDKLPEIARDSGVPKDRWEAVNTTAGELREYFNEVHTAIDERREPDYAAVAEPIEKALTRLEDISPAP